MARHKEAPSEPSADHSVDNLAKSEEEAREPFVEPQVDLTAQVLFLDSLSRTSQMSSNLTASTASTTLKEGLFRCSA